MDTATFFAHFERLTDAPKAVARLRELVLQLAVQGKLVEQDERDEPAAPLLERIAAERKRLVKEKKIREAKPLPPVSNSEKPFAIPDSWQWVRLGDIGITQTGTTPSKDDPKCFGNDFPFIKPADILPNDVCYTNEKLSQKGVEKYGRLASSGSVLMVCIGTIGKVNVIEKDCSFNQQINSLTPLANTNFYLTNYFLRSDYFQEEAWARANRTTIAILNKGNWENIPFPLPPLEEQKRIVAKVDELMRLCDELEGEQEDRRAARRRLNRAALDGLLAARDEAEFEARWQIVADHFPVLTAAPDLVPKLRQTVLQLAVQGKLTRQDPQDEPAPALLRRIRAERERLVKEKRLKRLNPLLPVNLDETPFPLPKGWAWCRLGEIIIISSGDFLPSHKMVKDGDIPVYGGNGVTGYHNQSNVSNPTLVIGRVGFYCGSVHLTPEVAWVTDNAFITYFSESNLDVNFIYWLIKFINPQMRNSATAQPVISGTKVYPLVIALPPLEEQKRIVAAVNRLMTLCDELEAGLRRTEEDGTRLLRLTLRSLLAPVSETLAEESAKLVVQ